MKNEDLWEAFPLRLQKGLREAVDKYRAGLRVNKSINTIINEAVLDLLEQQGIEITPVGERLME